MSQTLTTALPDDGAVAPPPARRPIPPLACLVAAGLGVVPAWWGGWPALLGVMLSIGAIGCLLKQHKPSMGDGAAPAPQRPEPARAEARPPPPGERRGAEPMVKVIVPVWSRQVEAAREAASAGLAEILANFAEISGAADALVARLDSSALAAAPGAVDAALREQSTALDALTGASQRAFAMRDEAVAELGRCADSLVELRQLAKQARDIARHTRLVALNASIESSRVQRQSEGGSQAVATEVRDLAARMGATGERIDALVGSIGAAIGKTRRDGEIRDTSPEELRLEVDLRAREALTGLLAALGASLGSSTEVHEASTRLREQLEAAFVHFQFGDRVSQMLSIVGNDMSNFAEWVPAHPHAGEVEAEQWLAQLDASYTMEEQRSHHHGNVHVEQSTSVEFF